MEETQLIQNPFGVNVFGSALLRVEPDLVSIRFAVSRMQKHPKDAFQEVRDASRQVRKYLEQAKVEEVNTSRVSISQTIRYTSGEPKFLGYTAKVVFQVLLRQLDQFEELLSGIVDAGVNEIEGVDFQTTKLKELRAEARRQAVNAAREKAENYCLAAGVKLGKVIHIEDVNPDQLRGREGHVERGRVDPTETFEPGSISIGAAVIVAYKLEE